MTEIDKRSGRTLACKHICVIYDVDMLGEMLKRSSSSDRFLISFVSEAVVSVHFLLRFPKNSVNFSSPFTTVIIF